MRYRRRRLAEGTPLAGKVVVDADTDPWVHGQAADLARGEGRDLRRLVTDLQSAAKDLARDTDGKLLADLAVVVGEDVARVGETPTMY